MRWWKITPILIALFLTSCGGDDDGEENAIRNQAKKYENAFNAGDAKGVAALWTEDAVYVNPETGEIISGRTELEQAFVKSFEENPDSQLQIKIKSISFPKKKYALELGTAIIRQAGEEVKEMSFQALFKNENGEWLIDRAREVESFEPPTQYQHLKELEWLTGDWVDEDEDVSIISRNQWDKYQNFLTQKFTVTIEGQQALEGKQIIGWDPVNDTIRSWIFDSDGGFGEGKWAKKDASWVVETTYTLADGRKASATNIYTPFDDNSYSWESVDREVGGELLPDVEPVIIKRKKG